jgi:hypothetical protein
MGTPHHRAKATRDAEIGGFPAEIVRDAHARAPRPGVGLTDDRFGGVVPPSSGLRYEADPGGHRVIATDPEGRVVFTFGGLGVSPGQFLTPLHAVTVVPVFSGEHQGLVSQMPWVAVADYGNHRIQFFEADGVFVGAVELGAHEPPCRLAWRDPLLDIITVDGRRILVHVSAALLAARHSGRPESLWTATFFQSSRRPC